MTGPVEAALKAFRASGSPWLDLPFFREGAADRVARKVDDRVAAGATVKAGAPGDLPGADADASARGEGG